MVQLTIELVRKRAEHNEGELHSLEELSLHQEGIEKIEGLGNWCPKLQILLLQGNVISKLENLRRLKCLVYLNLALNNIETVEGLERLESLKKLDLSINFIGDLLSITKLKCNTELEELYLYGNPCCDFENYRKFIIYNLPDLKHLDYSKVTRSEKILAFQNVEEWQKTILPQQEKYLIGRAEQKIENEDRMEKEFAALDVDNPKSIAEYMQKPSDNSPETRKQLMQVKEILDQERQSHKLSGEEIREKRAVKLYRPDGSPLNVNEPKVAFTISEDEDSYTLEVNTPKFMDLSYIQVDPFKDHVRVTMKGKFFQYVCLEEIDVESTKAVRSQTSGVLTITMPKIESESKKAKTFLYGKGGKHSTLQRGCKKTLSSLDKNQDQNLHSECWGKREQLEIGSSRGKSVSSHLIMEETCIEKPFSVGFVDDPEVPPLE
ncbi:dynein axonemal assembly factor 11-like [Anabrus simplex]|uniref:dynein axonemal assembly factor 11-like n=1 Tax=Anabrus simplex TaxID=316456 RepID=UPI0035A3313B